MIASLPNGTTARVHVDWSMAAVEAAIGNAFAAIRAGRMKPAARDRAQRNLAGAIGQLESIRLWLIAGAPEGSARDEAVTR